jgi:hypothetical protein
MRKLFSVFAVGLLLLAYACGGGGDDPKSVMEDVLKVGDTFIADMEKANDADGMVSAIEAYAAGMEELAPRIKTVKEKYPDLGKPGTEMPEDLKEMEPRFEEFGKKLMGMMGKMAQYASDPKVMEAQKKLMEAMKVLQ